MAIMTWLLERQKRNVSLSKIVSLVDLRSANEGCLCCYELGLSELFD